MSNQSVSTLLDVQNLVTRFYTEDGTVYAVNDVSFSLNSGESMAIVGESACGKSVSMLSILRLIPTPPGRIEAGKVFFKGRDLFSLSQSQMRDIRGSEIALILQDPMTSLNPVLSIKRQITEVIKRHLQLSNNEAVKLAIEMLTVVGLPDPIHRSTKNCGYVCRHNCRDDNNPKSVQEYKSPIYARTSPVLANHSKQY